MPYIVTAQLRKGEKRVSSQKYKTKADAEKYLRETKKFRPGSNPRLKKV